MAAFYIKSIILVIFSAFFNAEANSTKRPNIVFIVADDLGWDDVSFHGSEQVLTPNIDLLAYTGVTFDRHYTHCVCTPSRAALLTGKFAHTTGMHGYPLTDGEDRGLPLSEKLLPEYLKELGYATHLVGKWHLGQSRTSYLPTSRGFDSHFGYRGGVIDYYEYVNEETWPHGKVTGFDLYRNMTPAWDVEGYMTDVLTDEAKRILESHDKSKPLFLMLNHLAPHVGNEGSLLQAPLEIVRSMRHVENGGRRKFAAMMKKLDDSVGEIIKTLSLNGILENTIIVFLSDNGGMPSGKFMNYASNWPMRGTKFSPFEGGIRTPALLWTPALFSSHNHLWRGNMHIVDWLPTLLGAVGAECPENIDGLNLWNHIVSNQPSQRNEFYEIYTYGDTSFSAIVSGDYKLIVGNVTKMLSGHLGGDLRGIIGDGPSYVDSIKTSIVYSVLNNMGECFNVDDVSLRNRVSIECKQDIDEEMGYSGYGAFFLFNIKDDPCESQDLSTTLPEVASRLATRLQAEMSRVKERTYPLFRDPRALPKLHNYTWTTWADSV